MKEYIKLKRRIVEVVRHGRWIDSKEDGHLSICGAKMDGGVDDGT